MRVFLQVPFLTPDAARAASRAEAVREPVLLGGGPGRGAYPIARALHRGGDPRGFVSVRIPLGSSDEIEGRLRAALAAEPHLESIALYVAQVDLQPLAVQEALLRWIDEGLRWNTRTVSVRVLAQSDRGAVPESLLPDLGRRLSALMIPLPPLSARPDDIPGIAAALLEDLSRRRGVPSPGLTDEARQRLAEWRGTVEDLEAALLRGALSGEGAPVDAGDLGLAAEGAAKEPPPPPRHDTAPLPVARPSGEPYRLESVIIELAHELKNPMVTIKTFAQHMDHLLSDAELREKFTRLTSEAVERMDGFLEELLQFSRFAAPHRRGITFAEILSQSLAQIDAATRQQVQTNGKPRSFRVVVDEEQVVFALRALVRGLSRELPADTPIVLGYGASNEVVFRGKVTGVTRKLQSLLYQEDGTESETSLHFLLAETLLQRNGGTCRIVRANDSIEARVTLPTAEP